MPFIEGRGITSAGILICMNQSSNDTGKITDIRDQVRDPERVSLFIDGKFRLGLPRLVVAEKGLRVGQILTARDLEELEALDEVSKAVNQSIRLLSYRPRSRRELQIRLERKDFSPEAIESALGQLAEQGYVDDQEFARYWIENRAENRPRGKRLMASELRQKGVSKEIVDEALDEAEIDELDDAMKLARRRSNQLRGLDNVAWQRRMTGFLQRRGFGWETIRTVLDELRRERD
jgi:regulatory protein